MPRDTDCDHPNCGYGPCKALTPEELTPSNEDVELAERLIAEGWIQTSAKYRHIRRWKPPGPPPAEALLAPEFHDTAWGRRALKKLAELGWSLSSEFAAWDVTLYPHGDAPRKAPPGEVGCYALHESVEPNPLIEERTLTVTQFKAYKAAQRRRRFAPKE